MLWPNNCSYRCTMNLGICIFHCISMGAVIWPQYRFLKICYFFMVIFVPDGKVGDYVMAVFVQSVVCLSLSSTTMDISGTRIWILMKLGPSCFQGIKTLPNNFQQYSNNITTLCLCIFFVVMFVYNHGYLWNSHSDFDETWPIVFLGYHNLTQQLSTAFE